MYSRFSTADSLPEVLDVIDHIRLVAHDDYFGTAPGVLKPHLRGFQMAMLRLNFHQLAASRSRDEKIRTAEPHAVQVENTTK